MMYFNSVVQ